jgi:hypothetical protein
MVNNQLALQQCLKNVGLAAAHLELTATKACHMAITTEQGSLTTRDVALDTSASARANESSSGGSNCATSHSSRPSRFGRVLRIKCYCCCRQLPAKHKGAWMQVSTSG